MKKVLSWCERIAGPETVVIVCPRALIEEVRPGTDRTGTLARDVG